MHGAMAPENLQPASAEAMAISTIVVKITHLSSGQAQMETFWSGPIATNPMAVVQTLHQCAEAVDVHRSPLILPGQARL